MNKYTFSTKSGKAYYCNSIPGFINDNSGSIIAQLVKHSVNRFSMVNEEEHNAWDKYASDTKY